MKKMSVEEVKNVQVEILDIVSSFCDKHNIEYFLAYGTLLGAIRHKDFIPWDDDIDLFIPRKDYDIFVDTFNIEIDSSKYRVYTHENSNWYIYPFVKVSYEETYIDEHGVSLYQDLGVNIDIFPLDILPLDGRERRKHIRKSQKQKRRIYWKYSTHDRNSNPLKKFVKMLFRAYYSKTDIKKFIEDLNDTATMYNDRVSDFVGNIVWGDNGKQVFSQKFFISTILVEFRGKKYRAPIEWHDKLRFLYGDYMTLPPIEKQVSHHDFTAYWR